jgi:hypothetical protein
LIQKAQRVAHAAGRLACNERDGTIIGLDRFLAEHETNPFGDQPRGNHPEVEALHPAQDRHRDLVHLGGREHELDVRGRLLERLEQGVPGVLRQHVDLVHDEDLVAVACGAIWQRLLQFADLVDTGVARAVDLAHVHVDAFGNLAAGGALETGLDAFIRRARRQAVQRLGQNAGAGGFPHASYAGEQKRVRHALARDGVGQGPRHMLLTDEVSKAHRAPLAREDDVTHGQVSRREGERSPVAFVARRLQTRSES